MQAVGWTKGGRVADLEEALVWHNCTAKGRRLGQANGLSVAPTLLSSAKSATGRLEDRWSTKLGGSPDSAETAAPRAKSVSGHESNVTHSHPHTEP
jgi:hypothetical protein